MGIVHLGLRLHRGRNPGRLRREDSSPALRRSASLRRPSRHDDARRAVSARDDTLRRRTEAYLAADRFSGLAPLADRNVHALQAWRAGRRASATAPAATSSPLRRRGLVHAPGHVRPLHGACSATSSPRAGRPPRPASPRRPPRASSPPAPRRLGCPRTPLRPRRPRRSSPLSPSRPSRLRRLATASAYPHPPPHPMTGWATFFTNEGREGEGAAARVPTFLRRALRERFAAFTAVHAPTRSHGAGLINHGPPRARRRRSPWHPLRRRPRGRPPPRGAGLGARAGG